MTGGKWTFVLSILGLTINFHPFQRRLFVLRRYKVGWCLFFGIGSVAFWHHPLHFFQCRIQRPTNPS